MNQLSPLRYPGGKARVSNFMRLVILLNGLQGGEYAEPYAGGAGVALNLLFGGYVSRILINDSDPAIFAFWQMVTSRAEELCDFVESVDLTVDEWHRQRDAYQHPDTGSFDRACAAFYLNRTNRSGIIKGGGIIGGLAQTGKWKMDARFNRTDLAARIRRIGTRSSDIEVSGLDALEFLRSLPAETPLLCYLDPPYYHKASDLYANYYQPGDHRAVANAVNQLSCPWIVSYDNVSEIRSLYGGHNDIRYDLRYTARDRYDGKEIMFFSSGLQVPEVLSDETGSCTATEEATTEKPMARERPSYKAPPQIKHRDVKAALAMMEPSRIARIISPK